MTRLTKLLYRPRQYLLDAAIKRQEASAVYRALGNWVVKTLGHSKSHSAMRQKWGDARLRCIAKGATPAEVEHAFLFAVQIGNVSAWAVSTYVARAALAGHTGLLSELTTSPQIAKSLRPLLTSAQKRLAGDWSGALKDLQARPRNVESAFRFAAAERSIYYARQDRRGMAKAGMEFLKAYPKGVFLEFSFNVANSAQQVGQNSIMASALARALSDLERVKSSRPLLRAHWREASLIALKLFRLSDALVIAKAASQMGVKRAHKEVKSLEKIMAETKSWRWAVNAARRAVESAAKGSSIKYGSKPFVVVHSAAFSRNSIDYPGFRRDIRHCFGNIITSLQELGVKPDITFKLGTHGEVRSKATFFSYHTISTASSGVHFKETERPHSFSFDARGYSGWSAFSSIDPLGGMLLSIPKEAAEKFFLNDQRRIIEKGISKYAQPAAVADALPPSYIFVGLQVEGDAVQALAFYDAVAMVKEVISVAKLHGLAVVVKRHPQCRSRRIEKSLQEMEALGEVVLSKGNIHQLIAKSEAVCVVNSAVGGEALLHEKPVYVFGKSEYMSACFVCRQPGDFERYFRPGAAALDHDALARFWYALKRVYAVDLTEPEGSKSAIFNVVRRKLLEASNPEPEAAAHANECQ